MKKFMKGIALYILNVPACRKTPSQYLKRFGLTKSVMGLNLTLINSRRRTPSLCAVNNIVKPLMKEQMLLTVILRESEL
jgi:hypothetical protein